MRFTMKRISYGVLGGLPLTRAFVLPNAILAGTATYLYMSLEKMSYTAYLSGENAFHRETHFYCDASYFTRAE